MMGGIRMLWKFRIAKILLFQCPRWPPSWKSSNHISPKTVSQVEPKLDGRHQGDMEIQNYWIFSSSIQDGGYGGNLETLQTTSDSELLKTIWSDSQDGHHGKILHIQISLIQVSDFWPTWASSFLFFISHSNVMRREIFIKRFLTNCCT